MATVVMKTSNEQGMQGMSAMSAGEGLASWVFGKCHMVEN